jgi:hypothetical protein
MDCSICFNTIKKSAIGSCTHHFCISCLIRWCEFGGTKCPICKQIITTIRPDTEFDELNKNSLVNLSELSNSSESLVSLDLSEQIIVDFKKNNLAGVTLENNYGYLSMGSRGPGVVISKINEYQQCYKSGLRKNDIILFINNIPCIDHKQVVDIVNNCCIMNTTMTCELLKYKIKS